ncbi:type VI secretion system-associated protein TagF [Imhoffiella purpurea]|uniref:Protein phosphatase ImpM n=1 Tax=Imhoffiella purpurea TaxID=1249627 RepID=W9VAQ4_9GAMM|nr:type VI secretion system-associated protein TagF [Imhoffiella purpurea]EXJ16693.1 Protein phosphatase ImpM [Imhoffiella purpurea]
MVGFYGKLPDLGGVVTRRLPKEFIQPWDLWLRESLASGQLQLGDDWLDVYLTSPSWRFALTSGLAGQSAWAGVMMPSVDRVGHYFPLTLACPLSPDRNLMAVLGESYWFERAELLLLSTLEDEWTFDAFDLQVQSLGEPPSSPSVPEPSQPEGLVRPNAWRLCADTPAEMRAACAPLLRRALDQMFFGYSFWWSQGSERVSPSLLLCQGLPPAEGFSALIGGNWSGHGWWEFPPAREDPSCSSEEPR